MHDGSDVIGEVIRVDLLVGVFLKVLFVPRADVAIDNEDVLISVGPRLFMYKPKAMPKLMSNAPSLKEKNKMQLLTKPCKICNEF